MTALIDTNVAVHLRDADPEVVERYKNLAEPPRISVVTRLELDAGIVAAPPALAARRRAGLELLVGRLEILYFDAAALEAYSRLLGETGYSRSRVLDRMIAATALAHALPLITINGRHFRDIPGLDLIEWPSPPMP